MNETRTPVIEELDPGAYATYMVVRTVDGQAVETVFTTSDRFKAYREAARLSREDKQPYNVESKPSARYLREGGY